jgi:hypothetical protein
MDELFGPKPVTSADALKLLPELEMKLHLWLIADLCVEEKRKFMIAKWLNRKVQAVRCGC